MADGQTHPVSEMGEVVLGTSNGAIKFFDVLYVPGLSTNLLFVGKILDKQIDIYFDAEKVYLIEDTHSFSQLAKSSCFIIGHCDSNNGLYRLNSSYPASQLNFAQEVASIDLWHARLGHLSTPNIRHLISQRRVKDLPPRLIFDNYICDVCQFGKKSRESASKKSIHRCSTSFDLIHTDLCGPIKPTTISGYSNILTSTDDFSRFTWVYLFKHKNDAFPLFQQFW